MWLAFSQAPCTRAAGNLCFWHPLLMATPTSVHGRPGEETINASCGDNLPAHTCSHRLLERPVRDAMSWTYPRLGHGGQGRKQKTQVAVSSLCALVFTAFRYSACAYCVSHMHVQCFAPVCVCWEAPRQPTSCLCPSALESSSSL